MLSLRAIDGEESSKGGSRRQVPSCTSPSPTSDQPDHLRADTDNEAQFFHQYKVNKQYHSYRGHSTKFCRHLNLPYKWSLAFAFGTISGGESKMEAELLLNSFEGKGGRPT